jgi:dihydrofolate reductase
MIVLVAALGRNGVIGSNGSLPWSLPADLRRFRSLTVGKPVIMGRATHESIGRPLPDRTNIVLSRNERFEPEGAIAASDPEQALAIARSNAGRDGEICVIGGEQIYAMYLDRADRLELTRVEASPAGDAYFPEWHEPDWQLVFCERHAGSPAFEFQTLERRPATPGT